MSYLGDHIHPHGIASLRMEADVEIPTSQTDQQLLQSSKSANSNHRLFHSNTTCRRSRRADTEPWLWILVSGFIFYLLVWSKASLMTWKPSVLSIQALTSAAWQAEGSLTTGPRVMLSARIRLLAPPPSYGVWRYRATSQIQCILWQLLIWGLHSVTKDSGYNKKETFSLLSSPSTAQSVFWSGSVGRAIHPDLSVSHHNASSVIFHVSSLSKFHVLINTNTAITFINSPHSSIT